MAMERSNDAPQQYKQTGRKTKRDWRKNVDISEIQNGLEAARAQETAGGILAEKTADSLFTLDSTGSTKIQQAYRKLHKPLRSDETLAQRSCIPAIDTRARSTKVTNGVLEPSSKRRKGHNLDHKILDRLHTTAYGPQTLQNVMKPSEKVGPEDLWAEDANLSQSEQDSRFTFLDKSRPIRAPPTIRRSPQALTRDARPPKAVNKPVGGVSYNPVYEDWRDLLAKAEDAALVEERKRIQKLADDKAFSQRVAHSAEVADTENIQQLEEDSAWEGFDSDYERISNPSRKARPGRKTPQERKKAERRKERVRQEKAQQQENERRKREKQITHIKSQLDQRDTTQLLQSRTSEEAKSATTHDHDGDMELDNRNLQRKKLGKHAVPSAPLELVLPDELQDSLRLLKPEGNLLLDRYRNLLVQGKVESRRPITQAHRRRVKQTEKWTHKDHAIFV